MDHCDMEFAPGEWALLERLRPSRHYEKDEMIYMQGGPSDCFYYLKSGRVKTFLSSSTGMEKTLVIRESGCVFGEAAFFDGRPRMSSSRALEPCEIIPVGQDALLEAFSMDPLLAMKMLRYLSRTVRMLSNQLDHMTFLQADCRIARLLVKLCRPDTSGALWVPGTHEELGNLAGTSRITVSRLLNSFAKKGWIKTGYRAVRIDNLEALSEFAYPGTGMPPDQM